MNKILVSLVTAVLALAVWYAGAFLSPLFISSPQVTLTRLVELLVTGDIIPDIAATISITVTGFLIGSGIGIVAGMVVGEYGKTNQSLLFCLDFLRSLPATALFPLFLLVFGIGDFSKIAVVVFSVSLIVLLNTTAGVRHQSQLRRQVASTFRVRGLSLLRHVIFPGALPHIFTGLRIGASLSLILVVVSEMLIGTTYGMGRRIIDAQLLYHLPDMYAVIILTGVLGYLLNMIVYKIEQKAIHWKGMQ